MGLQTDQNHTYLFDPFFDFHRNVIGERLEKIKSAEGFSWQLKYF